MAVAVVHQDKVVFTQGYGVQASGGGLVLTAGPNHHQFPLTHWDGQTFTMVPTGENAPDGSCRR